MSSAGSRPRSRCISASSRPPSSSTATMMFTGSSVSSGVMPERRGSVRLTPDILLAAYAAGVFPMAESADDPELFWVDPHRRGILPLDEFYVPRRLRRVVRQSGFAIRCDTAFEEVIRGCAEATEKRPNTWINEKIVRLYVNLFARGAAHSVEAWRDGSLVGGLYGVSLGAA